MKLSFFLLLKCVTNTNEEGYFVYHSKNEVRKGNLECSHILSGMCDISSIFRAMVGISRFAGASMINEGSS